MEDQNWIWLSNRRQWHPTPVLLPGKSHGQRSLVGVAKSRTRLSDFTFNFHFHSLEKEMATHSSVLAWRIPGTGEPGGLPSMGSHRVGHDWSDLAAAVVSNVQSVTKDKVSCLFKNKKKKPQFKTRKREWDVSILSGGGTMLYYNQ